MFLIILSAAGLTAGLSEGGWRSIPQTATQCDYENQKPTWGILSRKVATLFRGLRREQVAPTGQLGMAVAVAAGNDYASKVCPTN